jgi:hypothetical protein
VFKKNQKSGLKTSLICCFCVSHVRKIASFHLRSETKLIAPAAENLLLDRRRLAPGRK